ncbi:gem-associated protein 7 [Colossoma macropomum]|uniref:gem-associated protein 7 n=1 Tax=Colossoma macropomum TaxID=42526 RepID=UPI0018652F20|nr:gem-associated protein 7 [Colossoma macropomum]
MRETRTAVYKLQKRSCENNMKTPVSVLRLPRGPEPNSRGFDPNSPRYIALCPTTIPASKGNEADFVNLEEEQQLRSELRERFLRSLIAMTDKQVQFNLYEKVQVQAKFGASDIDVLNFQVSDLQTPLGVQKEALLRCQDMISYSFHL